MYLCENCALFFREPLVLEEKHGLEGPWAERFLGCPHCCTAAMFREVRNEALRY